MNITVDTILNAAALAVAIAGFAMALPAALALRRLRVRYASVEASLAAVRRELELVATISTRTGRRLKSIEHDYSGVADRVELVELRGPAQSLDAAIDSARRGADPTKLTQQFGLSRGEADLVTRLHGRKKSA